MKVDLTLALGSHFEYLEVVLVITNTKLRVFILIK